MGGLHQIQPIRGRLRVVTIAVPAAGADWIQTVPTGKIWKILSVAGLLTTGVGVANRVVYLAFDDGTNGYCQVPSNFVHTASLAKVYTGAFGVPEESSQVTIVNRITIPIPPMLMPAGHRIASVTVNIQAADAWTAIFLLVEEFDQP